jgi:hypothetical protein
MSSQNSQLKTTLFSKINKLLFFINNKQTLHYTKQKRLSKDISQKKRFWFFFPWDKKFWPSTAWCFKNRGHAVFNHVTCSIKSWKMSAVVCLLRGLTSIYFIYFTITRYTFARPSRHAKYIYLMNIYYSARQIITPNVQYTINS